jgi:hypothetical protein
MPRLVAVVACGLFLVASGCAGSAFDSSGTAAGGGGLTKTIELQVGFQDAAGNVPASEMSIDNVTLQMQ